MERKTTNAYYKIFIYCIALAVAADSAADNSEKKKPMKTKHVKEEDSSKILIFIFIRVMLPAIPSTARVFRSGRVANLEKASRSSKFCSPP